MKEIPGLSSIRFYERTNLVYTYTYLLDDVDLNTQLPGLLDGNNRDFEGWPDKEFYDVFISDPDGTVNPDGAFVSIEARFDMSSGGGGLNICEIEFLFDDGSAVFGRYISSHVGLGPNYIPGSEEFAADCDLDTWSTMGSTVGTNMRMRVTIGLLDEPSEIIEESCQGSGYEVTVNDVIFNEDNPLGVALVPDDNNCDSLVYVDLTFHPTYSTDVTYEGCEGSGYNIDINGTTYDEMNPIGTEIYLTQYGCDSIFNINLTFLDTVVSHLNYLGCSGDGYSVNVNGVTYSEQQPEGEETLVAQNGCDSLIIINLIFNPLSEGAETYEGCSGDGYSVEVNDVLYDEFNPQGVEFLTGSNGCDSVVTIDLIFHPETEGFELYTGCENDGYSIDVNGTTYDEQNPQGTEYLIDQYGCDSLVQIDLTFNPETQGIETHTGCSGDGYSITVNGNIYDELNPEGEEHLTGSNGCDSTVIIDLQFGDTVFGSETYTGCTGDGYSVTVNGTVYDEDHPNGQENLTSTYGCDSLVTIDLTFNTAIYGNETYDGCSGDGYAVTVGNTVYDEANPNGQTVLSGQNGCDSIVTVALTFNSPTTGNESYVGCTGDGYSVIVGDTLFNESNPVGQVTLTGSNHCDSVVAVDLVYNPLSTGLETHDGCIGDGYTITVNGTIYDESNPSGLEILSAWNGCDSVVTIDLNFSNEVHLQEQYNGCTGDGYTVTVNGTLYNESNPTGTETIGSVGNCDTVVQINLVFNPPSINNLTYSGCSGDGYAVVVNGHTYDENNPVGMEAMLTTNGCDSIVFIDLTFQPSATSTEQYSGCSGDGFSIIVNGVEYNEGHPVGSETLAGANGCDSIINIDLTFHQEDSTQEFYDGCTGDGYAITVNGKLYDEINQTGIETLTNIDGCDSVVLIDLRFSDLYDHVVSYNGCAGDNYSINVNGSIYDESNPAGTEILQAQNGCDSVIHVALVYAPCDEQTPECGVFIPNVFSPDNNYINDTFKFYYKESCIITRFEVDIFDRWGALLFQSSDPEFEWSGYVKGEPLNPGVYVYMTKIYTEGSEKPVIKYGDITLMR